MLGLRQSGNILDSMVFKGGTCLRLCYFEGYRFSEDLDFSSLQSITEGNLHENLENANKWIFTNSGLNFSVKPIKISLIDNENRKGNLQVRIYFRGPLPYNGSPPTIKIDITNNESVLLPINLNNIIHRYSDYCLFKNIKIPCYSLEEMFAEKVRALCGQRKFAVSRDVYDIYQLLKENILLEKATSILEKKFNTRRMDIAKLNLSYIKEKKTSFEIDWDRNVKHLIPEKNLSFERVWDEVARTLAKVESWIRKSN